MAKVHECDGGPFKAEWPAIAPSLVRELALLRRVVNDWPEKTSPNRVMALYGNVIDRTLRSSNNRNQSAYDQLMSE